ncbi:TPA: hypothetical protein ACT5B7_006645 [Burkholderia cenocepacia]
MSDINAAPSSTEPAVAGDNVNATEVQTRAQEAGTATLGESPAGSLNAGTGLTQTTSTGGAGSVQSASLTPIDTSILGNDGTTSGSVAGATAANTTSTTDTTSGTLDGGDAGNADVSPAAGQSASDTASSAQGASQGDDTAADALRAELDAAHARIAALEQQITDEQERVIKWQGLYNAATATRSPEAAPTARRWLDVLERKVTSLEHDARAELLDVVRQLREAL